MPTYDPTRSDFEPFFTDEERSGLGRCAVEFDFRELLANPRTSEERAVDYAYVSVELDRGLSLLEARCGKAAPLWAHRGEEAPSGRTDDDGDT